MKAKLFCIMAALFAAITTDAKTLVVYYSFNEEDVVASYNASGQRTAKGQHKSGIRIMQYRKAGKVYSKKTIGR